MVIDDGDDRRSFFRVTPSSREPVFASVGAGKYKVKDISAGGIGIYRYEGENLEAGKDYPLKVTLPLIDQEISGTLKIIRASDKVYHCIFVDLEDQCTEELHRFVLERQKEMLREKKKKV